MISPWTPERIAQLRALAASGLTASQVGRAMGVSRNTIIGKAWRLKIAWGHGVRWGREHLKPKRIRPRKAKPMAPVVIIVETPEPVLTEPMPAGETGLDGCQWLHGEAVERNFCGAPVMFNRSWCAYHYGVVFDLPRTGRGRGKLPVSVPQTSAGPIHENRRTGLG